jgi:AraC-like DNA-binding protein
MTTLYLKYDYNTVCKALLKELLNRLQIQHSIRSLGELEITEKLSEQKLANLKMTLNQYGVKILDDPKTAVVERIKYNIDKMLEDDKVREKLSVYLAGQMHYSYAHLSRIFSETTFTSIETFVILRKVERAKELMATTDLTLTEIAYRLHYSSVAHLSGQFKKTTGLTATVFQKILEKRKTRRFEPEPLMTIK